MKPFTSNLNLSEKVNRIFLFLGRSPVLNSSTSGNLWLQQLHKCISKSPFALKVLPPEYLNRGPDEYSKLDPSKKLRLLNFLCEEALETEYVSLSDLFSCNGFFGAMKTKPNATLVFFFLFIL